MGVSMQLSFCYSLSRIPFYPFNQFWKRGNSFARMEKVLSPSLYWLTSKVLTVAGLIFSSPWSLLSSVAMLKQLVFIWLTSVFCSSGAMTRLKMRKALVFPQGYGFAVFEFGKMFSNNGPKWLCSTRKPVTLTLLALTSLSTSELTATKSCVIAFELFCYLTDLSIVSICNVCPSSFFFMLIWNGVVTD